MKRLFYFIPFIFIFFFTAMGKILKFDGTFTHVPLCLRANDKKRFQVHLSEEINLKEDAVFDISVKSPPDGAAS